MVCFKKNSLLHILFLPSSCFSLDSASWVCDNSTMPVPPSWREGLVCVEGPIVSRSSILVFSPVISVISSSAVVCWICFALSTRFRLSVLRAPVAAIAFHFFVRGVGAIVLVSSMLLRRGHIICCSATVILYILASTVSLLLFCSQAVNIRFFMAGDTYLK